ncbi:ABC transporter ATP-binding protein [Bradyrhizobium sp. BR 10261]|uniref:ABC transporter ATP-binding protein n=1 Tax=Bradyrhizobium sp. BR 10261 TaxID=2749992 RepID=UPI001C64BD74|nr:ABC transporter ATP-binding protein [Bradyrhizobium sp. BR 10261]MBW7967165.1 ABC transporter ATP-binding protein [Bradyrhizobium sp. BR 10261]
MFKAAENWIKPTISGAPGAPPQGLLRFYWFFLRQFRWPIVVLLVSGLLVAVLDALVPALIGWIVRLVTEMPRGSLHSHLPMIVLAAAPIVLLRPAISAAYKLVANQAIAANTANLVRWQSYWHVTRQSWSFFQSDFAGRLTSQILATGPALRDSVVMSIQTIWYALIYGASAILLLALADVWLAIPTILWFAAFGAILACVLPRMRQRSREMSDQRSLVTGRMVDTYTNIQTIKLFTRPSVEDHYVREALDAHTTTHHKLLGLQTYLSIALSILNASFLLATGSLTIGLWDRGRLAVNELVMIPPLCWHIVTMSESIIQQVASIFENIGAVQEGMRSIAHPVQINDPEGARELQVREGDVLFRNIRFNYGRDSGLFDKLNLHIAGKEKVGLVGGSGSGKSTLAHLLLRFFDPTSGQIAIDGQDIASISQESLRSHISMVTQDTSLLHRSIVENIRYGSPDATDAEVVAAAQKAHAHDFIERVTDWKGRRGYNAHVGERGAKLSGGQRQRILIARVFLKNAPILILDEATSSLDAEAEAVIHEQLSELMNDKTAIVITHKLSTVAHLDRLVVLDRGRLVEEGTHADLLRRRGRYAELWRQQTGEHKLSSATSG